MPVIPFALQCTIQENQLLALKDSENGYLNSVSVSKIPGIKYYLTIYPNGDNDERHGQTWIGLGLKLEDVKTVVADCTILIESANYSFKTLDVYKDSMCWGDVLCKTEEFFNPEKKFIVDGKFTIKVHGTFKFETNNDPTSEQQKWDGGELGDKLWEDNDDKDITIVVEGKEIKVHKLLLRINSDVFKAMFNPNTKESIESKFEIPDFSFNVVETAVKMIYISNFTSSLAADELMSLLQFFDKYNIPALKEKVELLLINQISAATVCRLTNASILTNSIQLKMKCLEFLVKSFASKTPVSDIKVLDKDFLADVFQNMVYQSVEIQ